CRRFARTNSLRTSSISLIQQSSSCLNATSLPRPSVDTRAVLICYDDVEMEQLSEPGQGQYDQYGVGCEGLESGGCSFSTESNPSPAMTQNNNTHETDEKLGGTSSSFFLPGLLFIVYLPSINGKAMSSNLGTKL
ncbi:hypothetical protein IGI04_035744, partial [Brassica rapa subsp. trilocularis]